MSGFYITKCFLKLKEQEDCWWETTITKISTLKNLQDNLFFMYNKFLDSVLITQNFWGSLEPT